MVYGTMIIKLEVNIGNNYRLKNTYIKFIKQFHKDKGNPLSLFFESIDKRYRGYRDIVVTYVGQLLSLDA